MKYFFFSIILYLSSMYCYPQSGLPVELHFNRLTVQNGLPEGTVLSMIQDKEGYIWMSTQRGLVRYDGYHARIYTMGITDPNKTNVTKIFQDRKGRLWVGMRSSNSIYLYNRQQDRFIRCLIDSSASDLYNSSYIFDIHDDNRDRLWIASYNLSNNTSSFFLFHPQTGNYQWYGIRESGKYHVNATFLLAELQDSSGHIWLSTSNGLYEFNENSHSFTPYLATSDSAKQKGFVSITEDSNHPDYLWLTNTHYSSFDGSIDFNTQKGLWRFNTRTDSAVAFYHDPANLFSIASDTVFKVFNDRSHRLWIGTEKGLSLYNPAKNNFINYYPTEKQFGNNDAVIDILEDKAGNFWCQTGFGLLYFNTLTRTFTRITANPKQSDGLILNNWNHTLMLDKNGTLWFGVQQLGIQWINRRRSGFVQYSNNPGALHYFPGGTVSPRQLYGFAKASDGTIWIGANHGLYHWRPGTDSFTAIKFWKGKAVQPSAGPVMVDKKGKIWFGGGNNGDHGLDCYDPRTGETTYYRYNKKDSTSLSSNNINAIYQDHSGNIWVGTDGGGICKFDPATGKFTRYPYIRNNLFNHNNHGALDDALVYFIVEDKNGTLWVGTNRGSLNRFNRNTGTFTSYLGITPGLTTILSIKEGPKNDLWVGTYDSGIFRFNPKTSQVERYTEKNGLLYNGTFAILRDSSNNLWLPSYRGISIFNPKTGKVRNLTGADGLPGSNFTFGFKVSNNQFLFSCDNGFISVNPEDFTPDTHAPLVNVQSAAFTIPGSRPMRDSTMAAFGKKNIELAYNENRLTFRYVGLYYQNANLVHYAYKLDGYDENWISAGTQRTVVYTNLSPGTYNFRIKAANPDGVWSKDNPSIIITINPPWWKTGWAYSFYGLFLILGIIIGDRIQRHRVVKREREHAELKQKTQELEEARKLQLSMLPKDVPQVPNLDIAVYMQTATEVGGDYYDFRIAPDRSLNIALGDATGHGMQAGTLVTIMKGIFTIEADESDVIPFFQKSVQAIKEIKLGRLMMAFAFLKIKGTELSLSNAGVPPVYIYRKDKNEVEEIDNKGMPLGAMSNFPYKETKTELKSGDVIYLLSDGFPELSNNEKEMYGYERIIKTFKEVANNSAEEIIEKLKKEINDWSGDKLPEDDVTFVVIKVK